MPAAITSLQNPTIKRLVRLRDKRSAREAENVVLVEGLRECQRAILAGWMPRELYATSSEGDWPISPVLLSKEAFIKVSNREHPDGILGVFERPAPAWPSLPENARVVLLHGLEKPGNIGAILRSADSVGAAAVIVLGRGADIYGPNVIRASQGSVFHVPLLEADEDEARDWLKSQGVRLFSCTPEAKKSLWEADFSGRVALLLGTEHEGLPPHWRDDEHAISVPMRGSADSLNVATAAAIVLYEALRQSENP